MFVDCNEVLRLKFQGLHVTIVQSVNAARIIDFLFQESVVGADELQLLKNDTLQQCRDLLALLHTTGNPQAFLQLYRAIRIDPHLQWLVKRIDEFSNSAVNFVRYTSDPAGKYREHQYRDS